MKKYSIKELRRILKERHGAYNMIYTNHFFDYLKAKKQEGGKKE